MKEQYKNSNFKLNILYIYKTIRVFLICVYLPVAYPYK